MSAWDLPRTRAREQLPKALGTGVEAAMQRGIEQVQVRGRGIGSRSRDHVDSPVPRGAAQETALVRDLEESTYEFHFESKNGTSGSVFGPDWTEVQATLAERTSRDPLPSHQEHSVVIAEFSQYDSRR